MALNLFDAANTPIPGAAGPARAGAKPVSKPKRRMPGLLLPGIIYAALLAAGATAVEATIVISNGSYVAWSVILAVMTCWVCVAVIAVGILSLVLVPVLLVVKGRFGAILMPALVVALGFVACALDMQDILVSRDALGAAALLRAPSVAGWGIILAVAVSVFVFRAPGYGRWPVVVLAVTSILSGMGMSFFVAGNAALYALAVAPLTVILIGGFFIDKPLSPRVKALVGVTLSLAVAAAFVATAYVKGKGPLAPIDRGYTPDPGKTAMLAGKPNLLIITLDTARADHMSVCGYKYPTTPNLEEFAKDCRFFPNAVSVNSWTLPAHASLFTGKYPREHGAHADPLEANVSMERTALCALSLAPSQITIATYLSMKGFNTAAFVANYAYLCRQFGTDQGFRYYHDTPRNFIFLPHGSRLFRYGSRMADRILGQNGKFQQSTWSARTVSSFGRSWMKKNRDVPFFLFLNYMDPHEPYSSPPPFDNVDGRNRPTNYMVARHSSWGAFYSKYIITGKGLTDDLLIDIERQYDGEMAYADHWVGWLLDCLKSEGLYDDMLIVITSDHGEFFGEHQLFNHGVGVYEGGVRIPIFVKYPGNEHAGEVIDSRVSIIDIFATVFDVMELPVDKVPAQPLERVTHQIVVEDYEKGNNVSRYGKRFKRNQTVIYDGDYKYVRVSTGDHELYNLKDDPCENDDLVGKEPEVAARLDALVSGWVARTPKFDPAERAAQEISPETVEKLKALGYIGSGAK